jgi:hypothetical protein
MTEDERNRKLYNLYFGWQMRRIHEVTSAGLGEIASSRKVLAYYTTAETAMKVLESRTIWLRNGSVVNDYSELSHGWGVVQNALTGPLGDRFRAILNSVNPTLAGCVFENHDIASRQFREDIFTASLSEQDADDPWGRLSMWRAYGGPVAGVALIFKSDVAKLEIPDLYLEIFPVFYGYTHNFSDEFENFLKDLEGGIDFLKSCDPVLVGQMSNFLLESWMFTIKHPGFHEEQEWRVIRRSGENQSLHVLPKTVTLGGIPQMIYELPFHNPQRHEKQFNLPDLDLNEILECVMIGPCAYPETVKRALCEAMTSANIENPLDRIKVSNIPLRQRW